MSLAIYGIPNYSSCYETYGMAATEEIVRTISETLLKADPDAEQIARISEDQFVVVDSADSVEELIDRHREYLDCFVFELLEDRPASDEELARLKRICKEGEQTQVAIDDYGTGHSNIINLLRYNPQIIKIDRGLITGIESDHNRRLFVQNTIDFAHQNGIKALAEEVETLEELNMVIECGIDLIQGYYTGRPSEKTLADISDEVRDRMVEANLQINRYDKQAKIYYAQDGEEISLLDLALKRYTALLLRQGSYARHLFAEHSHIMRIIALHTVLPQHISHAEKNRIIGQIGVCKQQSLVGLEKSEDIDNVCELVIPHVELHL